MSVAMYKIWSLLTLSLFVAYANACDSYCFSTSTKWLNSYLDFTSISSGDICSGTTCTWKIDATCSCVVNIYSVSVSGNGRLEIYDGSSDFGSPMCTCDESDYLCSCSYTTGDVAYVKFTSYSDSAYFSLSATAENDYVFWSVGATIGVVIGCIAVIVIIVVVVVVVVRRRRTPYYPPAIGTAVPVVGYTTQPPPMVVPAYPQPQPPAYIQPQQPVQPYKPPQ